ncbi:hypothetical protein [Streptomyces cellostaticus]|uniref:hypothetical protein n=1 Tax=Streptomyces cellostaticus TaxID=67285 RepID=UPI0020272656|nr:hypothetical protein [Streptomyces cellostaticus]
MKGLLRRAPPPLVLDEPTSALDPQAEHDHFDRFPARTRDVSAHLGPITVLMSHRFSTVHMVDHVVVPEEGRITGQGSHTEPLAVNSLRSRLFTAQGAAYGAPGPR